MPINVTDKKGNVIYTINTDATGKTKVTPSGSAADRPINPSELEAALQGMNTGTTTTTWDLKALMKNLGSTVLNSSTVAAEGDKAAHRLKALNEAITGLNNQITAGGMSAAELNKLKAALTMAKNQLKTLFTQLDNVKANLSSDAKNILQQVSGSSNIAQAGPGSGKATISSGGTAQPQQAAQSGQAAAAPQQSFPTAGASKATTGQGGFDVGAFLQSSMMQGMNLNSMGQIDKNQRDQKAMMMLFMYYAMMAMSGDVGAMTQFMQFIGMIIQKDKAMLNINLANKLIELEDNNRKAIDVMMKTPSFDPNNPQVERDFAKVMERTKAEQGSIATSQKLISQMMEDFAQVSEFMNNLQKSMLDVRGRLLSRLSTFNA